MCSWQDSVLASAEVVSPFVRAVLTKAIGKSENKPDEQEPSLAPLGEVGALLNACSSSCCAWVKPLLMALHAMRCGVACILLIWFLAVKVMLTACWSVYSCLLYNPYLCYWLPHPF